ncbi:ABC transporter ATP-binding protein [Oscillospiraceae bacterium Marseille-Q3528]|nr:ABC transporter ATP-binding protein [Oscillospiraceae bacterium Marseille-Q3528]
MGTLLELKNVTKIYEGGVLANHNICFDVREGEIHALVGENGAGKSTLMKILFGLIPITSGQIFLRGEEVHFASSSDAIAAGIGMVHQHFMLVDSLTGAENLMLGIKEEKFISNRKEDVEKTRAIAAKYNFDIDPERRVRDMSVGMKQKLEILKILYRGAKLIILDEPTAVLTPQETEELFERLIDLKKQGMTIIFISHKLNEVKRISDRITVLKGGKTKGTFNTADVTEEEISNKMVGRVISFDYEKEMLEPDEDLLKVENLTYKDRFDVMKLDGVSFTVRNKEIVGIAGVEGNGQSELIEIITANLRARSGQVLFKNEDITKASIDHVRKLGMSYVPEDRLYNGCAAIMSVQENMVVSNIDSFAKKSKLIDFKKVKEHCKALIKEYNVKTKDENQPIKSLSGGNIQKAIVAREFCAGSDLLVLDQPTRGVDVGAMNFIHQKILEMRSAGKGIILASADLNELIALSDRILVMHKGRVVASLSNRPKVSEQELGLYMLGIKHQEGAEA